MELAQSNGKMVLLIKVNGLKARLMGTADLYSQMVTNTWEATKMTKLMAGESCTKMIPTSVQLFLRVSSKMMLSMALEE